MDHELNYFNYNFCFFYPGTARLGQARSPMKRGEEWPRSRSRKRCRQKPKKSRKITYFVSIVVKRGFGEALDWAPMIPRHASISDGCTPDRCKLFQSGPTLL